METGKQKGGGFFFIRNFLNNISLSGGSIQQHPPPYYAIAALTHVRKNVGVGMRSTRIDYNIGGIVSA